ncbi:MAG: UDP-N-acetylmuramate:L-alanyl-gamma-D-glutamyl-meso-diaminopimelate ligase, partial [Gammaproteobacteria bacterium]|nr:UDP-N-acetylmuramate:L-alanyl-gamma-D-glutamyl-meso-diaminopimelate ligase [Gammaproteobacteria bacterium]
VEAMLEQKYPYISGPQWLAENVLRDKWVLAVSGTHGKTSTSSMLAWILEYNGYQPGFLIGGVPANFSQSARYSERNFFVIEADEYDSAFFDKRSKFVHYHPDTLVINNLEFDHADIFEDLSAIQKQFHHVVRTVPSTGMIVHNALELNIDKVLAMGCWSETRGFQVDDNISQTGWSVQQESAKDFAVYLDGKKHGEVHWQQLGQHNVENALAAIAAAHHVGLNVEHACNALKSYHGVKRRLEVLLKTQTVTLYDDFAHHPTAIETTLSGIRAHYPDDKIVAVFDPHSNTMKRGEHNMVLANTFTLADQVLVYAHSDLNWSVSEVFTPLASKTEEFTEIESGLQLVAQAVDKAVVEAVDAQQHTHVVILSNGSFSGMHQRLIDYISR